MTVKNHSKFLRNALNWTVSLIAMCLLAAPLHAQGLGFGEEVVADATEPARPPATRKEPVAISMRCGVINTIVSSNEALKWLDLDQLLLDKKFQPTDSGKSAETTRVPGENRTFLIIEIDLKKGMSIGRYDYNLAIGGEISPCLAMARGDSSFDPRAWQIEADDSDKNIRLLYETVMPERKVLATLIPAINSTLPLTTIEIPSFAPYKEPEPVAPPPVEVVPPPAVEVVPPPAVEGTPAVVPAATAPEPPAEPGAAAVTPLEPAAEPGGTTIEPVEKPAQPPPPPPKAADAEPARKPDKPAISPWD